MIKSNSEGFIGEATPFLCNLRFLRSVIKCISCEKGVYKLDFDCETTQSNDAVKGKRKAEITKGAVQVSSREILRVVRNTSDYEVLCLDGCTSELTTEHLKIITDGRIAFTRSGKAKSIVSLNFDQSSLSRISMHTTNQLKKLMCFFPDPTIFPYVVVYDTFCNYIVVPFFEVIREIGCKMVGVRLGENSWDDSAVRFVSFSAIGRVKNLERFQEKEAPTSSCYIVPAIVRSNVLPKFVVMVYPVHEKIDNQCLGNIDGYEPFCKNAQSSADWYIHLSRCTECQRRRSCERIYIPSGSMIRSKSKPSSDMWSVDGVEDFVSVKKNYKNVSFHQFFLGHWCSPLLVYEYYDAVNKMILVKTYKHMYKFAQCTQMHETQIEVLIEGESKKRTVSVSDVMFLIPKDTKRSYNRKYFTAEKNRLNIIRGFLVQIHRQDMAMTSFSIIENRDNISEPQRDSASLRELYLS